MPSRPSTTNNHNANLCMTLGFLLKILKLDS